MNIDNIQDSLIALKKHLEDTDHLISDLEQELDREGAYHYVDSAMNDIKVTYDELLKYVDDLESDLENSIEDEESF